MTLFNPSMLECPHCHSPNVTKGQFPNKIYYIKCVDCGVSIESTSIPVEKYIHLFEKENPMIIDALKNLPKTLIDENGGSFGFVCIWRSPKDGSDEARRCSVGEFLSKKENQSGTWYIDGGWGGPPGPIRVDWDEQNQCWINKGFPPH